MSFEKDIHLLADLLESWWANRMLHQHLDGADVKGVRERLLQRSSQAKTLWEFAAMVRKELYGLGDGHLQVRSMFGDAECGFVSGVGFLPVAEGTALAWMDTIHHAIDCTKMSRGDLLVEVDQQPVEAWLSSFHLRPGSTPAHRRWNAIQSLSYQERFRGETPGPSALTLEKPDGSRYSTTLAWKSAPQNQPTLNCLRSELIRPEIGYVEIRTFYCLDELGQPSDVEFRCQALRAAEKVRDAEDLIIDLRQNSGGRDQQGRIAAGLCMRGEMEWFRYRHLQPYSGAEEQCSQVERMNTDEYWPSGCATQKARPLWFLIGPGCFSSGEVFASALRNRGNAIFVGQPTGGGAGNPVEFRLPYSGLTVTIPVSEIYMAGTQDIPIETNGIQPDIPVIQTAAELRAGRDAVLEKAADTIQQRKSIYA